MFQHLKEKVVGLIFKLHMTSKISIFKIFFPIKTFNLILLKPTFLTL